MCELINNCRQQKYFHWISVLACTINPNLCVCVCVCVCVSLCVCVGVCAWNLGLRGKGSYPLPVALSLIISDTMKSVTLTLSRIQYISTDTFISSVASINRLRLQLISIYWAELREKYFQFQDFWGILYK